MKKKEDVVKYETKGFLNSYTDGVMKTLDKKENEDSIDFNDLLTEVKDFCDRNSEKEVVVKFIATASE